MPKHIMIAGAAPLNAPKGWDAGKHGHCGVLHVLPGISNGLPTMTSAYRMSPAELSALAKGGELYLQIIANSHPVISMWVQPPGKPIAVDDGLSFDQHGHLVDRIYMADQPTPFDIGYEALIENLNYQAENRAADPDIGDPDEIGQIFMKGVFNIRAALEAAIEAIGAIQVQDRIQAEQQIFEAFDIPKMELGSIEVIGMDKAMEQIKAGQLVREIPVTTLSAIAAEAQAQNVLAGAKGDTEIRPIDPNDPDAGGEA